MRVGKSRAFATSSFLSSPGFGVLYGRVRTGELQDVAAKDKTCESIKTFAARIYPQTAAKSMWPFFS
jgi:hypothetical protein